MLIVADSHLDKTILNQGKGTYIKGKDILPGQLVEAAMRYPELEPGSVVDIKLNQDNRNNDIINLNLNIEEINKFKNSKREQQNQEIPKFCEVNNDDIDKILLPALFKYSLIGTILRVLISSFNMRQIECCLMKQAKLH